MSNHSGSIASASGGLSSSQRIKSILSACSGNLVEWYDFFIYAYTAIYFAGRFFPSGNQTSQLMATAGIFAVGFLMRPLGGWVFGYIADTRGRKVSMIISIFFMCGGSLIISLLPTHASIGVWAPAILVLARLMQGLSVGAEYGTGATYISEVSGAGRRSFFGSFQYATIIGGQLMALTVVGLLQHWLTADQMREWGWRIPFFLGAVAAIVVVYLRRAMVETADEKEQKNKDAGSLTSLLKKHPRAFFITVFITMGCSLFFYTFTSYMQKFLVISAGMPANTVSLIMTSALVIFMLAQPIMGLFADRIGARNCMLLFAFLATVFVVPLMFGIQSAREPWVAFLLILVGLFICGFYTPVTGVMKADLYPASIRALGVGFPYAIGNALCGGTAEYVALTLRSIGVEQYFFYYVAAISCLTFIAALLMPDLRQHGHLDADGLVEENVGFRLFSTRTVQAAFADRP